MSLSSNILIYIPERHYLFKNYSLALKNCQLKECSSSLNILKLVKFIFFLQCFNYLLLTYELTTEFTSCYFLTEVIHIIIHSTLIQNLISYASSLQSIFTNCLIVHYRYLRVLIIFIIYSAIVCSTSR